MEIYEGNDLEIDYVEKKLSEHDEECMPITQSQEYIKYGFVVKENDEVIGGIVAHAVKWGILYVSTMWVAKEHRRKKLATKLMDKAIEAGVKDGCYIAHLSTFDFQGPEFYEAYGFQKYAELKDAPLNHSEIFFYKKIGDN